LLIPTFFFRTWSNVMFGLTNINKLTILPDLSKKEFIIFSFLLILMFWLGFSWQCFIF
jgi:NADH:ubiquinone oxidoreductase subunit 4 (subunit M)